MLKRTKTKDQGFTIIEVMIVLAIAGLILLIVFLAVPALQRTSRNTQRKNDVSAVLTAVGNYVSNNNGQLPNKAILSGDGQLLVCKDDADCTGPNVNAETAKIGYYKLPSDGTQPITFAAYANNINNGTAPASQEKFKIVTGAQCDGSNAVSGSPRAYVALYTLENNVNSCQEG